MMSITKNLKVTVIIPTYNEENFIVDCLKSLATQTYRKLQIIIVDDGSSDRTLLAAEGYINSQKTIKPLVISQKHKGPGEARNFGAGRANGEILIFVDADMTFNKNFIKRLISPIVRGESIGVDSQEEFLANPENYWARCWNIGRFAAAGAKDGNPLLNMVPNRMNHGGIYRAILRSKFEEVGGFESGGDYSDDESLVRKLKLKAVLASGAVFYHRNPETLEEVWQRASWIANGRRFTGTLYGKIISLLRFSFPISLAKAIIIGIRYDRLEFVPFKILFDFILWVNIAKALI